MATKSEGLEFVVRSSLLRFRHKLNISDCEDATGHPVDARQWYDSHRPLTIGDQLMTGLPFIHIHHRRRLLSAAIAGLLGFAPVTHARPAASPQRLADFSRSARARTIARQTPVYQRLLRSTDPAQIAMNHEPGLQLMFIGARGVPVYYGSSNLNAAKTVRTWDVWPSGVGGGFIGLTGSTTLPGELAVWDEGRVRTTHQEFGGRVTQMDSPTKFSQHSTHVSGTLVAAGVNPAARGMSYQAPLHAYDWKFDTAEMAAAAAQNLEISSHSYGEVTGWLGSRWYGDITVSTQEDYGFGYYDDGAHDIDSLATLAPAYLVVIAAGNDRNQVWYGTHQHWDGHAWVTADDVHGADFQKGGYDTVSWFGTAKDALLVGAVDDIPGGYTDPSSVVMMPFSSWGPCDDGRIKPDIVANGYALVSCDTTDTGYITFTGTSMAAPNAAGSINLIAHEFTAHFGSRPLSSTLKALVINTADEAGSSEGPDYSFGWGLLDTRAAIELLQALPGDNRGVMEQTLAHGEARDYHFTVDTAGPVRLTIAWTDPPGTPPPPSLNPPDKMLVNDLDVRITSVSGGVTTLPWTLDRLNPAAPAVRGDNSIDNMERIDIDAAPADQYVVHVTHKGTLSGGSQAFAMVWSGMRETTPTGVGPLTTPRFALNAMPNPVRSRATIGYQLDRNTAVSIRVYDVRGRLVATLVENATRPAGPGSVPFDTRALPSGVYFIKMSSPSQTVTKKITVVK